MARDAGLEELIREELGERAGLSEKAMFGGWAYLLHGNLLLGAREGSLLVRLGKGNDGWALALSAVALIATFRLKLGMIITLMICAFCGLALRFGLGVLGS